MKKFLLFVSVCLLMSTLTAQQITVRGIVVDKYSAKPLPNANVLVEDVNLTTVSNTEGFFELNLPKEDTYQLKISYMGYKPFAKKLFVSNGSMLKIELEQAYVMMAEIEINATKADDKTPVAFSNVPKETLNRMNTGVDVPKLLDAMPSLTYSSDNGSGIGYSDLKIRGTDMTRINVTMNGVPLNNSESHEMYFVDMPDMISSVDNIQIQRGVGTSVDGPAAFGATMNFQTNNVNATPYSELTLSGGSFNTLRGLFKAGTGLINNKFSTNIALSKINSDGFLDRGFSDLASMYVDAGYYGQKFYVKFINLTGKEKTYQAWNGSSREQINESRTYNTSGEMWVNDSLVGYYDDETDNYLLSNSQLAFGFKILPELKLNATVHYTYGTGYYQNYKNDEKFSEYQQVPNTLLIPLDSTLTRTNLIRQKWVNSNFWGTIYSLNYKKNNFDVILGGGYNDYLGDHFGRVLWAQNAVVTNTKQNWYQDKSYKKDFNQYLKLNIGFAQYFNVFLDAQYRYVNYRLDGFRDDFVDITQTNTYNFFNPKAGIVYNGENHRAYLSFAVAHREPSRDDFTDSDPGKTPKPEKLFDYELGYQLHFDRLRLNVSLYYMDYTDQLVLTGQINNVGAPIKMNVAKSFRRGIELEGAAEIMKNHIFWNANLTLSQNKIKNFVDYVDDWDNGGQVAIERGTTNISFSPSVIAFNQFRFIVLKDLSIALNSKYVGKQYIDNSSVEAYSIKGYFVNDVRFDYAINFGKTLKGINLFASVNNILNAKYETKAWIYRYYYEGVEGFEAGYFPQAGINFMCGATFKF